MVRISDCRMSGTAFGTIILHVTPEAAIGGSIGLIQNGDEISLSVSNKSLNLNVSKEILDQRKRNTKLRLVTPDRGYAWLYAKHVTQANQGVDFDFLMPKAST